jgi:hypothetical protein
MSEKHRSFVVFMKIEKPAPAKTGFERINENRPDGRGNDNQRKLYGMMTKPGVSGENIKSHQDMVPACKGRKGWSFPGATPARLLILVIISLCTSVIAGSSQPKEPKATTTVKPPKRTRAEAKITVQNSGATPFDQTASPALMEIRLNETFTGELDGESEVGALQVLREDHSASLVSEQRFRGKLGGRQGTFVLQGEEIVENGKIKATWFVIPGSGTGDLSGLRGEGGFEGDFGKGSRGTLDYWFELL